MDTYYIVLCLMVGVKGIDGWSGVIKLSGMAAHGGREREPWYSPDGNGSGEADNPSSGSDIVNEMVHNLNRLKALFALGQDNPEVARMLLDREKAQAAVDALSVKGDEKAKEKALNALGIHEKAEQTAQEKTLDQILGIKPPSAGQNPTPAREKFEDIWFIDRGGSKKSVEEIANELSNSSNPDIDLVRDLWRRMESVRDTYGIEELKGVELNRKTLAEIDTRIALMKARVEFATGVIQKDLRGGKTATATLHGKEIQDQSDKGLLKVRAQGAEADQLKDVVERVRQHAAEDSRYEDLEKLNEVDLISRFEDVNQLLTKMSKLDGYKLKPEERVRLRYVLTSLQIQYQEKIAQKIAKQWTEKENKSNEWAEVASKAVEQAFKSKRKMLSEKIELEGKDAGEKFAKLSELANPEAKKAIENMSRAKWRSSGETPMMRGAEGGGKPYSADLRNGELEQAEQQVKQILGNNKYNPFEDKDFISDLMKGEEGVERIVSRAERNGSFNRDEFKNLIEGLQRQGFGARTKQGIRGMEEEFGSLDIINDLMDNLRDEDYGAAANAMLEYTTRVGMQENTNDLQYMYVRRMFMERIGKVSPDFAEQFQKNQAMNYLPGLTMQKPEDFYNVQGKIFAKSNADLFFGKNAFMSGNRLRLEDGREVVISTKTFLAALRSERNQMRLFQADPNSNDSTLQNILLEEMYGKGTRMVGKLNEQGEQDLYLALPGQDESQWRQLSKVFVNSRYAKLGKHGFAGWNDKSYEMTLEEVLNRNQWMLRNSMQFMWYSEMWMDTLKSYQPSIMANTPKALLTAASAIADYKASFENVAAPYLDVVQRIGDMLGPMERYKAADMVGRNVADELTAAAERAGMSESDRIKLREKYEKIGDLFKRIYVRQTTVEAGGHHEKVNNRIRTREMTKMAFNNLGEFDAQVGEIVRTRLLDMGHYEADVPTIAELQQFYTQWKELQKTGRVARDKSGYMGQEYAAVWQELKELQMSDKDRELWAGISSQEFKVLVGMNEGLTGIQRTDVTKDNFWKNQEIEAFIDRTSTKHADDWEQFAMKYSGAKQEALKVVFKIAHGAGTAEDYIALYDQLSLFATPEEKRVIMLILMERQHLMTSEQWVAPYEIADIRPKKDENGKERKGTAEIDWVEYKGSNGQTYFARTVDGTRAFQKKMYRGNYARQVLGKDMWRPHDFEIILERLRGEQVIDKHEQHHLAEKILGTRRNIEYFANGFADRMGIPRKNMEGFINRVSQGTSWIKLQALKLFIFDDPKWALWSFAEESVGLFGKTFEHIFGFAVGGSSKH